MYALSDYHYHLPRSLIAQQPAKERDGSRLLCLDKNSGALSHHRFRDAVGFLDPGDLLVVNNTEVIPARLVGRKQTGGRIEALLLNYAERAGGHVAVDRFVCDCLIKASKGPRPGARLCFGPELTAEVLGFQDGVYTVEFFFEGVFEQVLYRIGDVPLPPYIRRKAGAVKPCEDQTAYQTVYASKKGAVAAPTAGLHFSKPLMERIRAKGVHLAEITLHVGYGTFIPVRVQDIRAHKMHGESYTIGPDAARAVNRARSEGRRVIAVGTTSVRTLEYAAHADGTVTPGSGSADLFIYPGYRFKAVDALITNFHLPGSTLLMLVSAFAGKDRVMAAYSEAVREKYRFFSYGDAMFIR